MADERKRTYSDLKGRTEMKPRNRKSDRIPGDQFDADKALGEGFLNVEENPSFDDATPVDESEVEVVSFEPDFEPGVSADEALPYEDTSSPDDDYEDGYPEVDEADVEEEYYDTPEAADEAEEEAAEDMNNDKEEDPREQEGCMQMKTTGSFEERLRIAMEPMDDLAADLGEEAPPPMVGEDVEVEEATEGPCPAGCEPATVKEDMSLEDDGILDVSEDEVEFVDEGGEKEARPRAPEATAEVEEDEDTEDDVAEAAADEDDEPVEASVEDPTDTDQVFETLGNIEAMASVTAEQVDLILTREESDDPQYVVLIDGNPVAKVALSDQPENLTTEHPEMFLDEDYPRFVLEGIQNFGLDQTLQSINARYYAAATQEGALAEQMKMAAAKQLENEHRTRLAEMKDGLLNTANIVLEGSLKNYIVENPLRDELVRLMKSAGVDESSAIDIAEDAFRAQAGPFFRSIMAKAEEWLGAPEGVLDHHINEITKMNYRHPGYSDTYEDDIPQEHMAEAHAAPQNVPIRTVASPQQSRPNQEYDKEYWKQQMNLHGNLVQASLTNKR
jgi:hypothetical protein